MANHLRVAGRYLQTPVRAYTHPDSARRIWLAGVVHFGLADYYDQLKSVCREGVDLGAEVHIERLGTRAILRDPPPDLTGIEKEILAEYQEEIRRWTLACQMWGLVDQYDGLPAGADWRSVGLNTIEFIRRYDNPEDLLASVRANNAGYAFVDTGDKRQSRWTLLATEAALRAQAQGRRLPGSDDRHRIHAPNAAILSALDSTDRNVVVICGASHLPGIEQGLVERQFQLRTEQWLTAMKLTSLPRLLLANLRYAATHRDQIKDAMAHARQLRDADETLRTPTNTPDR